MLRCVAFQAIGQRCWTQHGYMRAIIVACHPPRAMHSSQVKLNEASPHDTKTTTTTTKTNGDRPQIAGASYFKTIVTQLKSQQPDSIGARMTSDNSSASFDGSDEHESAAAVFARKFVSRSEWNKAKMRRVAAHKVFHKLNEASGQSVNNSERESPHAQAAATSKAEQVRQVRSANIFFRQQQKYAQSNLSSSSAIRICLCNRMLQNRATADRQKQRILRLSTKKKSQQQIRRRKSTRRPVSRPRATRLTWRSKTASKNQYVSSLR